MMTTHTFNNMPQHNSITDSRKKRQGNDIAKLLFQFHCKGEKMNFAIKVQMNDSPEMITYLETQDQTEFKNKFEDLSNIRYENQEFYLP